MPAGPRVTTRARAKAREYLESLPYIDSQNLVKRDIPHPDEYEANAVRVLVVISLVFVFFVIAFERPSTPPPPPPPPPPLSLFSQLLEVPIDRLFMGLSLFFN